MMKGNIMKIVLIVLLVLLLLGTGSIVIKNRTPQVALGIVDGKFHEISKKPNCVSTQTVYDDKRVEPLAFKASLAESKDAMKKALESYGSIEIVEDKENYIYAIATTGKMKYHDDIEIYFDKNTNLVHYRSASRAGYSDMGLNRERYDAIAKAYLK